MSQVLPLLVVIGLVAAASLWYRGSIGAVRRTDALFGADQLRTLGVPTRRPSMLLFTAPGCSPCTAAKKVLDDVGGSRNVEVVVADVTDHPEIAAAQHVYRAPTIFVIDERGHAISRIAGVPDAGDLTAVLSSVELRAA